MTIQNSALNLSLILWALVGVIFLLLGGVAWLLSRLRQKKNEISVLRVENNSLVTEKNLFDFLLDNLPFLIYFKDNESRFIRISKHFSAHFGKSINELIGKRDFDFQDEVHASQAFVDEQEIINTQIPKNDYLEKEVHQDGEERWVSTSKMPLLDQHGKVIGILGISKDVTIMKLQAEELNQQKEDIQSQSEYLAVVNAALIAQREEATKARAEAEQANQAKSIFLATMSHEIRTPMNGVMGMASLLAETPLTVEQKEYTTIILSSGEALLTVINDILDFSKIESGKLELDNHGFDLRQCIEDVLDVFSTKAAQKGLDLVYQIDYQVPAQIIGDSHRLRQVLINLVGNAMKFTHQGEIFIGVDLLKMDNDRLELVFQIRDTGVGIPEDKLSRLFKAFSQVDSSTTRKYGGTGLGLVISQRLVELMGGSIGVESQPGVGSSFGFTIKSLVSQQSIRQYVNANLTGDEGKRVLVVDDNSTNLTILKNQLEQWKLLPTLASSGSDALQILAQQEEFDLVITDMQMPDMDGVHLTKLIKIKHPSVPVILLSSIGDESRKKHPELFSAVLNKPVKQQQFSRVLHAVFSPEGKGMPSEEQKSKQILSEDFAKKNPLRILIAEDNPVNQKLTTRVLNKLGYQQIVIAKNGLEVIEKFDEQFFDVILMDVQMPELDGLETTRMIRSKHYQQPIIIAMTANAMQGDKEVCLKAGMDDYISKPVKLEILVETLEKWALKFSELTPPTPPQ